MPKYTDTIALATLILGLFVWLRNDIADLRTEVNALSKEVTSLTTNVGNLEARVDENNEKIAGHGEKVAENARVIANINGRLGEAIATLPEALREDWTHLFPEVTPTPVDPPSAIISTPNQ